VIAGKVSGGFPACSVDAIMALGFKRAQAEQALRVTRGNVDRAAAWLTDQAA